MATFLHCLWFDLLCHSSPVPRGGVYQVFTNCLSHGVRTQGEIWSFSGSFFFWGGISLMTSLWATVNSTPSPCLCALSNIDLTGWETELSLMWQWTALRRPNNKLKQQSGTMTRNLHRFLAAILPSVYLDVVTGWSVLRVLKICCWGRRGQKMFTFGGLEDRSVSAS